HARCSQEAVVAALKVRGLWRRSSQNLPERPPAGENTSSQHENEKQRIARAREIIFTGNKDDLTLARRYFEGRGLASIISPSTRILPGEQSYALGLRRRSPAIVLQIGNRVTGVRAVHVIHLSRNGRVKLDVPEPKKTYGVMKGGYVVVNRLDGERLI